MKTIYFIIFEAALRRICFREPTRDRPVKTSVHSIFSAISPLMQVVIESCCYKWNFSPRSLSSSRHHLADAKTLNSDVIEECVSIFRFIFIREKMNTNDRLLSLEYSPRHPTMQPRSNVVQTLETRKFLKNAKIGCIPNLHARWERSGNSVFTDNTLSEEEESSAPDEIWLIFIVPRNSFNILLVVVYPELKMCKKVHGG